jgi:hypothetical protein
LLGLAVHPATQWVPEHDGVAAGEAVAAVSAASAARVPAAIPAFAESRLLTPQARARSSVFDLIDPRSTRPPSLSTELTRSRAVERRIYNDSIAALGLLLDKVMYVGAFIPAPTPQAGTPGSDTSALREKQEPFGARRHDPH